MIESEEVLVATSADGFSFGHSSWLDALALGRRLDHHVAVGEGIEVGRELDARQRRFHVGLGHDPLGDLAAHALLDVLERPVHRLLADVGQQHVVLAERDHMGDAAAHLPRPDHADLLDDGDRPRCRFPPCIGLHCNIHGECPFVCRRPGGAQ